MKKSIGIHILNFDHLHSTGKYHNVFAMKEKQCYLPCFADIEIHAIELKKFCPTPQENSGGLLLRISDPLDMWAAFFARHDLLNTCSPIVDGTRSKIK